MAPLIKPLLNLITDEIAGRPNRNSYLIIFGCMNCENIVLTAPTDRYKNCTTQEKCKPRTIHAFREYPEFVGWGSVASLLLCEYAPVSEMPH